ncbi:MAG: leucyl/phenylalanyl-tRNA--protein transferase [Alphaproteobacteria bacterium]|nr:leucyl/phenylalanyl-tRNA--protein transferase [Alphaproteobacteria bacterium]
MSQRLAVCYEGAVHAPLAPIDPEILLLAYRSGVFPMSDARDDPEVFWIEPRLRAILPLDHFHLSHSLARTLRRRRFRVTCNAAFSQVMDHCAAPRDDGDGSWISYRIQASYERLHALGHAHSIECWQDREGEPPRLVGGLYGVGFDRVFCGESMFSCERDASKVALAWLVAALRRAGAELLDCQFMTEHLASLGAVDIPQERYLALLKAAQRAYAGSPAGVSTGLGAGDGKGAEAGEGVTLPEAFGALLDDAAEAGFASSPGKFIAQSLTQTS